jgi:hypothetical protein
MNQSSNLRLLAVTLLVLLTALVPRSGRAAAATAPAEAPPGSPKSVFNSQPDFGKDPFYPSSKRRDRVKVVNRGPETQVVRTGVPSWVMLKGFAVLTSRKLAIINNQTVETGEDFFLKPPGGGQHRKFKCVEIKENSVVISADGESKELQLRPGL